MANWNAQELYGSPERGTYKRISLDRLERLEACERTLQQVYEAAREAKLIGEYGGAKQLLEAIRAAGRRS